MTILVAAEGTEITATIVLNASLAAAVNLTGLYVTHIIMPAAWDAAALTFAGSATSGGTYADLYDATGTEYTVQTAAARRVLVPPGDLLGDCWLKVRSGLAAAAVAQTAARNIILVVRQL